MYSLRARYYTPVNGRFLSQDKANINVRNPSELNRYSYTINNPINGRDPSGLIATAGTFSDYGWLIRGAIIGAGLTTGAGLVYLGPQALEYIAYITAELLIAGVRAIEYLIVRTAERVNSLRNFSVAVALGKVNGEDEIFIAFNNYYTTDPATVALYTALRAWALLLTQNPKRVGGAEYQPGARSLTADHAETNMVWLLQQNVGELDRKEIAYGTVLAPNYGMCNNCRLMSTHIRNNIWEYPIDYAKDIQWRFVVLGWEL